MGKYFAVLLLTPFFFGGAFFYAYAHEGEEHSASYNLAAISIAQDEVVDPGSLGVGTVGVLPGNPLYFFKNLSRGVRSTVTFGAEKKAELKLQFANEKIAEAQLLSERGDNNRAAEHLKSYEKDLARAKGIADKEKFITQIFKHQGVIDKIEKEAGEGQAADIKDVREKAIEHIAEAVVGAEDQEAAKNALISATSGDGSAFKPLRNLEILKAVEGKVPEQAKEAIRAAQENAVKRFKGDYDKGTEEEKAALTEYVKSAGGDASRYIEAFNENKEILGEELSGKLVSAVEVKKATVAVEETKPFAFSPYNVECVPPVPPKPNIGSKSEVGTMTITPEISEANKNNAITVSVLTPINPLAVSISSRFDAFTKSRVIDWGPKEDEIRKELEEEVVVVEPRGSMFVWQTVTPDHIIAQRKIRPRLNAQKYWVKFRAPDSTVKGESEQQVGNYGWGGGELEYSIHYVVGDGSRQGDFKTSRGKNFYYVGGPQRPEGQILRVGANAQPPFRDKITTVKAGGTFDVEAKAIGFQGGTMTIRTENSRVIGPASIAVKAGESAVWKVFPTGKFAPTGRIDIKNNCTDIMPGPDRGIPTSVGSFETRILYDFQGLTKDKARLSFYTTGATNALKFGKQDSVLDAELSLKVRNGDIIGTGVPEISFAMKAVYKDNPEEIVKNILIGAKGKTPQPGSATVVTDADGVARINVTAPNLTKEEASRGIIILKATTTSMGGLEAEIRLLITDVVIDVTPPPVVEKKEEPKAEIKQEPKPQEPKPYEGSPPLLY